MRISKLYKILIMMSLALNIISCKSEQNSDSTTDSGKIVFKFNHNVDGLPLLKDSMIYINEAGNHYKITELKYFISDVTLHKSDGTKKVISEWKDIDYIDMDIQSSLTWDVYDKISVGKYDSISFTFGINTQKNQTFMYVNPPEVNMMWPSLLGGGYHYLMINGKWIDPLTQTVPFNFHLGIGQLYKSNSINSIDSIYAFVPNFFNVKLPNFGVCNYKSAPH